jgi:ABC-type polysaccharide/polyol phosphate export permease
VQVISSQHHLSLGDQIRSFVRFRWLLVELVKTEIKLRYRRSTLGVVWTVMNPVLNALVLYFVFRAIFKFRTLGDIDFFPYVYSGVLLLNFFTQAIVQASEQLTVYSGVLRRVNIPGEIFVIAKVCGNIVNFVFGLFPLLFYFLLTQHQVTWKILLAPLVVLSLTFGISAISIFLSVIFTYFRDIQHLLPVIMAFFFYLTPVFYSIEMIGGRTRQVMELNPLVTYLDSFRNYLNITGSTNYQLILLLTLISIFTMFLSMRFMERNRMKAVFLS